MPAMVAQFLGLSVSVAVGCLAARRLGGGNAWETLPRLPAT
ncbi:MAG: hypothetical protein PHR35_02480 [Kiritimatiellae bacterium]|nr:hypothetical protein [Kiritimatiellia bacterium]